MLFNPSSDDVRHFFRDTWRKARERAPLTPLESIALGWIERHPEYHAILEEGEAADDALATAHADGARENPFLHLSMHLAIAEQLSIDQPPGIRAAFERLCVRRGDDHDAVHQVMECLGETLWRAQRERRAPDGDAYLECVRRRAS